MRRIAPREISSIMQTVTTEWAPQTPLGEIQQLWSDVVGEHVANQTHPVSERDRVVTVACKSAVWANELTLMSKMLIDQLNSALSEFTVRELRFKIMS